MRASQLLIPTLKETPADADIPSHRFMLRAGLIREVPNQVRSPVAVADDANPNHALVTSLPVSRNALTALLLCWP